MHKTLLGLAAAVSLGLATVAAPAPANAVATAAPWVREFSAALSRALSSATPSPTAHRPLAIMGRHRPLAIMGRRRPRPTIRRPALATRNWRPAAIGESVRYGLTAPAIAGGPSRSANKGPQRLPLTAPKRVEFDALNSAGFP